LSGERWHCPRAPSCRHRRLTTEAPRSAGLSAYRRERTRGCFLGAVTSMRPLCAAQERLVPLGSDNGGAGVVEPGCDGLSGLNEILVVAQRLVLEPVPLAASDLQLAAADALLIAQEPTAPQSPAAPIASVLGLLASRNRFSPRPQPTPPANAAAATAADPEARRVQPEPPRNRDASKRTRSGRPWNRGLPTRSFSRRPRRRPTLNGRLTAPRGDPVVRAGRILDVLAAAASCGSQPPARHTPR
jgi:hypothetical protein